ncbi:MAG: trypsin-like peptidase domain-containing protein [Cyanobacteria bacterium NC_groundwater_1444_Ag_S-0.65um_54_12]|nr:trypsin-like peptidase domain-containing protein [Cyanobacteria bacterium NC_groundwater_1444_Ag_S-0.65um_54_12]
MAKKILAGLLTLALGAAGGAGATVAILATRPAFWAPAQAAPASVLLQRAKVQDSNLEPIADLVERVVPAVVNIDTVSKQRNPLYEFSPFFQDPFFGPFGFNTRQREPYVIRKGVGSGFIIDPEGLVVTNNHVVAGATERFVTLSDGKKYKGKVVGTDPGTDLALIKIAAKNLPILPLADHKNLRVGQVVIAIGSPLGLQHTVTSGILSAMNRMEVNPRVNFLQTDAPINRGNSGGPLLNLRGEVIGVNTAIAREGQGIGFAIPVSTLQAVIPQLRANGTVERPWLGVGLRDLPEDRNKMFFPSDTGALIAEVMPDSPAAKAGLQTGDVVLEVDGKVIRNFGEVIWTVAQRKKGDQLRLLISREGQKKAITVTLEKMPDRMVGSSEPQEESPPEGQ